MNDFEMAWAEFKDLERRIHSELKELNRKVDDLREFRWRLAGQVSLISTVVAGAASVVSHFLLKL